MSMFPSDAEIYNATVKSLMRAKRENATLLAALKDARAEGYSAGFAASIEATISIVENFEDWQNCECSECKADVRSHAIDEQASLRNLQRELQKLL